MDFNFDAVQPQTPVAPSSAGFSIVSQNTAGQGLPLMNVTGLNGIDFILGFSTNGPQPRIDQVIQADVKLVNCVLEQANGTKSSAKLE